MSHHFSSCKRHMNHSRYFWKENVKRNVYGEKECEEEWEKLLFNHAPILFNANLFFISYIYLKLHEELFAVHLNASGTLSNNTTCLQMLRNNTALNRMKHLIQLFYFCISLFPMWVLRSSLFLWCQWVEAVYVYVHYHRIRKKGRQAVSTAGIKALLYSMSMGEQTHSRFTELNTKKLFLRHWVLIAPVSDNCKYIVCLIYF